MLLSSAGPHDNVLTIKPPMVFSKGNARSLIDACVKLFDDYHV